MINFHIPFHIFLYLLLYLLLSSPPKNSVNSPLGDCPKVHKLFLKNQMEADPHKEKYVREYERSLCCYLKRMVDDLDARIIRERKNLVEFGSDTKRRRIQGLPPMNTEQLVEHRVR